MDKQRELQALAETVAALAIDDGADAAEVIVGAGQSLSVKIRQGQKELLHESESHGLGLRVFVNHRSAVCHTSDLNEAELTLLPQTRRHSLLCQLLRVESIVFAVNKLDAVDDPQAAFDTALAYIPELKTADQATQDLQRKVLAATLPYWQSDATAASGLGFTDMKSWEATHTFLRDSNLLKSDVDLSKAFTNDFLK